MKRVLMGQIVAVVLLSTTAVHAAGKANARALIAQWLEQNGLCRGLSGDDPRTQVACDRRQTIGRALDKAGWCYGRKGEAGYQMRWHRCGAGSTHYE